MKEHPILFSAPMVRALLAGTKTQTRRVVKYDIRGPSEPMDTFDWHDSNGKWVGAHGRGYPFKKTNAALLSPYGQPGDRLWVRETHAPQLDCSLAWERWMNGRGGEKPIIHYAADASERAWVEKWRPSIHMPRWASRITLEVTGVRVERLQDISEEDAMAEGCSLECMTPTGDDSGSAIYGPGGYQALWESINGPGSWDANPWVWIVEFKKLEQTK